MKKNIVLLFFLTSFFLGSTSAFSESQTNNKESQRVVTVRSDKWMPYNGDPDSELPGYMIEIADYAFKKHGYKLDYKIQPWERSLELVKKGDIDCVVGAFKTDARNFVFHQISFGREDVAFYGRIDARAWKYEGIKSFKGNSIGVIGAYSYGPEIDYYIANPNHDIYIAKGDDALERNIKMLLTQRIDILVESPTVFEYKTKKMPSRVNIKELDRRHKPQDVYFACSPAKVESARYAQWLDEGITELRKNGGLSRILAKYGLHDWQK